MEAKIKCRLEFIPISSILISDRDRKDYGNTKEFEEFKASITENGLITPIAVMEISPGQYQLLAGGRRTKACTELGMSDIAAHIYPMLDDIDRKTIELKENMDRKALSPIEEAMLTLRIHELQLEKYGKPDRINTGGQRLADTASILNKSTASVVNDIKIARMAQVVPELGLCKTKSEMLKMIEKAEQSVHTKQAVMDFERKTGLGEIGIGKNKLAQSYRTGDFFDLVKGIPSASVSLVELDPPYGINLHSVKSREIALTESEYTEIPLDEYTDFMQRTLKECYRILTPDSWLIIWFSIRWHFTETIQLCESAGFKVNTLPNIWNKKYGQTLQPNYNLASCYDTFLSCRKGIPNLAKPGRSNVFDCKPVIPQQKQHAIERPIQLMEDILMTFIHPGSSVVVPFAGSGNTLLAASNLQMPAIGFELIPEHRDIFVTRVDAGIPGMYASPLMGTLTL